MWWRAEKQQLVFALKFLIRPRIDDGAAFPFDADNARAGARAEFQFPDQFPNCGGGRCQRHRLEVCFPEQGRQLGRLRLRAGCGRLGEGFLKRDLSLAINPEEGAKKHPA